MNKKLLYVIIFIALAPQFINPFVSSAAVPMLINYQGVLKGNSGNRLNGAYSITFRIYSVSSGGTALWTETQPVNVTNGFFSVLLGSVSSIPPNLFNGASRYLGVQVGADPEMMPRQQNAGVPYAIAAGNIPKITYKDGFPDSRYSPTSWGIYTSAGDTWDPTGLRKLTFTKDSDTSLLKITYQDTIGYSGHYHNGCNWRIYLDGIVYAKFSASDTNTYGGGILWHMENASRTVMVPNITSGSHTVTIGVIKNSTATSCLAGWNSTGEYISVEEFFK